jgi:hypothetical protein
MKIFSKKYIHESKSLTTEILELFVAFALQKVKLWSFVKAGIRIRIRNTAKKDV